MSDTPKPAAWQMVNPTHPDAARRLFWQAPTDWHITWEAQPLYDAATIATLTAERDAALADAEQVRASLAGLLAACDQANARAVKKLGGIVVDFTAVSAARRAHDGSVSFCGGWPNVLDDARPEPERLDWSDDAIATKAGGG